MRKFGGGSSSEGGEPHKGYGSQSLDTERAQEIVRRVENAGAADDTPGTSLDYEDAKKVVRKVRGR